MESLTAELKTLNLLSTTPPSPGVLTQTLLAELHPAPSPTLEPALLSLGYTGAPTNHAAVLSFLLSSLRAQRLLHHHQTPSPSNPAPSQPDDHLADALSRLRIALRLPASPSGQEAAPNPAMLITDVTSAVRTFRPSGNPHPLGTRLLSASDSRHLISNPDPTNKLLHALNAPHAPRIAMQLHRLRVTAQAFGRAAGSEDAFAGVVRGVERVAKRVERNVSMFEAVAARANCLDLRGVGVESGGVKTVVMGAVPDRGGRIGVARGLGAMPGFRERVGSSSVAKRGKGGKKGRAGRKRRGRDDVYYG